jgi:hypothetical protein
MIQQIENISSAPNQGLSIKVGDTGDLLRISLYFREQQSSWFMDLEYRLK